MAMTVIAPGLSSESYALCEAGQSPSLIVSPHPILASAGRTIYYVSFLPGESIEAYFDRMDIKLGLQPWLVFVNGDFVPREWWRFVKPKPGTLITLRATVHKGGGGKNPLATVLSIALMIVAPELGAMVNLELLAAESALAFQFSNTIIGGIISFAGNLVIGSLLPPSAPHLSQANGTFNEKQVSPTYALTGGSNRARPYEPLPLLMGRHIIFPDLGAKTFTEFIGDDQYLYQTLNFGLSEMSLSEWKIGETPLSNYQGVTIYQGGADGKIPNFPSNVDSIAGASLTSAVGWITRTSSEDATSLAVDIQGSLFAFNDNGMAQLSCSFELEYRPTSGGAWLPFRDDVTLYYPNYWSKGYTDPSGNWVQLDYGTTTAGEHTEGESAGTVPSINPESGNFEELPVTWHWRPYSEILSGSLLTQPAPVRSYTADINSLTITNSTRKPIRSTYRKVVTAGQYEVRVRRTTADATDPKHTSEFSWTVLRTYQTDTADYSGQRRVGVRIKASGQIQGTVDQLNAVGEAVCRYWTGSSWAVGHTRNPAWWFLYFANGKYHPTTGRITFGCGLADARIDIAGLKAWATFCTAKGLTFDGVFDSPRNRAEVLNMIARCGRASPTWATGNLGVIWDAANQPHVATFGMANIKAGSFRTQYATEKLADEIVLAYMNPTTWKQDTVRVVVPGYGVGYQPTRPVSLELFGCANQNMAGKEANLSAAAQRYLRRRIQWETDFEGMVAQRGDVVIISHDLTQWGTSGRLVAATDSSLTFDRKVQYDAGSPYVMVTTPSGTDEIRAVDAFVGEQDTVTLTTPLSFDPGADVDGLPVWDYKYVFDPKATPGRRVKIIGVPKATQSGQNIQFVAQDDDDDYYASETGDFTWTPPNALAQPLPAISNLAATEEWTLVGNSYAIKLVLTWDVDGAVDHAAVYYAVNEESSQHAGNTIGRRFELLIPDSGTVDITVSLFSPLGGIDMTNGIATLSHTIVGKLAPPADVTGFTAVAEPDGIVLAWNRVQDPDLDLYLVKQDDVEIERLKARTTKLLPLIAGTYDWSVTAIDASGVESLISATASLVITGPAIAAPTAAFVGPNVVLNWPTPTSQFQIASYEVRYGTTATAFASATSLGSVNANTFSAAALWLGTMRWWVRATDIAGNVGVEGFIDVVVSVPTMATMSSQVLDNNVLLYWSATPGSLPITTYEVRKGATWAGAEVIGTKTGGFTSVFESVGATYTYWVAPIDSAGNYGTAWQLSVAVSQPPDYVFLASYDITAFSGTLNNAFKEFTSVLMPVNTTETWQEHFDDNTWTSPQDQITAGYPIYIEPSVTSGYYEETIDYGTVIPSTKITVTETGTAIAGTPVITVTISTKLNIGDAWTDNVGVRQLFTSNFRYIKVKIGVASAGGDDLYQLDAINVTLDVKLKNDAGMIDCVSSDSGGTIVNFNQEFVDISSIVLTPSGTTLSIPVYDFYDVQEVVTYSVTSNVVTVTQTAHPFKTGMDVRLAISTGAGVPGVYEITVTGANTYTAAMVCADTTGDAIAYPQAFLALLFDAAGARQTRTASWSIKGN